MPNEHRRPPNSADRAEPGSSGDDPAPLKTGSTLTSIIANTLNYAIAQGLELNDIQSKVRIDRTHLLDPEARLPDDLPSRLWLMIEDHVGGGPLALHMARATSLSIFGPWTYPLRFAPDMRTAIDSMSRFQNILADRIEITIEADESETLVTATHPNDVIDGGITNELGMTMLWRLINESLGCAECVDRIELSRGHGGHPEKYREFFDCDVHHDRPRNAIIFRSETLSRPIREGDETLYRYAVENLSLLEERWQLRRPEDPLDLVRLAAVRAMENGNLNLESIAAELHMSPRSLQRLTQSRGTRVTDLIEDVLGDQARSLLSSTRLDLGEIARRLGYADDRSFRRAFRRWTGMSPTEFRDQS